MENRKFKKQWEQLTSSIDSHIIRQYNSRGIIVFTDLEHRFREELNMWDDPYSPRGMWMSRFEKAAVPAYSKMLEELHNTSLSRFDEADVLRSIPGRIFIIGPVIGAAIGVAVCLAFSHFGLIVKFAMMLVSILLGYGAAGIIVKRNRNVIFASFRKKILAQLEEHGKMLGEIAAAFEDEELDLRKRAEAANHIMNILENQEDSKKRG